MLEFVMPPMRRNFRVVVCDAQMIGARGRAFCRGSRPWILVEVDSRPTIVPGVPPAPYLPKPPMSRAELVLFTLAHELRHLWQWRNRMPLDERDADVYALRALRRWRRTQ